METKISEDQPATKAPSTVAPSIDWKALILGASGLLASGLNVAGAVGDAEGRELVNILKTRVAESEA